jgi:hypothetical protein
MALTPEQQEHNRREAELVAKRKRREEQALREAGLWGRPLTAEERAKKDDIRRDLDEWENAQRNQFKWF